MRITTQSLLIAAPIVSSLTVGQPAVALTEDQIEEMRLSDARRATLT